MTRRNNWYHFAYSYLSIAEGGCLLILNHSETLNWKGIISNYSDSQNKVTNLILPILFNLRHAIELLLKNFNLYFQDRVDHTHNISQLFSIFEKFITDNKKKILQNSEKDTLVNIFIDDLHNKISNLEGIVKKYYYLEVLKVHINNDFDIVDIDNTGFKYPENSISISIDYCAVSRKIKIDTIKEIHADIINLYEVLSVVDICLYDV